MRRIEPDERYLDVPALKRLEELFERPTRIRPSRRVELVSDGRQLVVRRVLEHAPADYEYHLVAGEDIEIPEAGWRIAAARTNEREHHAEHAQSVAVAHDSAISIIVRNRRRGDRFRPLGMDNEKKLSDFFIDRKIPKEIRDTLPLVLIDGRIAWIVGTEVSEDFRLEGGEAARLVLSASRLGDDR